MLRIILLLIAAVLVLRCDAESWDKPIMVGTLNQTITYVSDSITTIEIYQSGKVSLSTSGTIPDGSDFTYLYVCLSYGFPPNPDVATWNDTGCIGQNGQNALLVMGINDTVNLNLRETITVTLYVTVGLNDPSADTKADNVHLTFVGTTCEEDEINYEGTCYPSPVLKEDNQTSIVVNAHSRVFFLVEIGDQVITNALKVMLLGYNDGTGNNPFILYIRYGAAPTDSLFDIVETPNPPDTKELDAIYENPGAGYLVISIVNTNDTQINSQISVAPIRCTNNQTGPSCNITVEIVEVNSYNGTKQLGPLSWSYYVIDLSSTPSFYIASTNPNTNAPDAYARIINFPTLTLFDLVSKGNRVNVLSSQQKTSYYVHVIGSIYYPVTRTLADATKWYVGLYNPSENSSLSYGTWANTPCPNGCGGHGTCENNMCVCNSGFSGFACEVEQGGFKVEYIILIVVGAAIVVSALIGIIVWAVKKRKRNQYESF